MDRTHNKGKSSEMEKASNRIPRDKKRRGRQIQDGMEI